MICPACNTPNEPGFEECFVCGKALFALSRLPQKPRQALFIHTGGLPGLMAQAGRIGRALYA